MECLSRNVEFLGLLFAILYSIEPTSAASTKLHIHEIRLSTHNDTDYVEQLLRNAKAAEMGGYMRPEVSACDNFFEFACGNWAKINPANGLHPRETNFYNLLTRNFEHKQLRVLQSPIEPADDDAEIKMKNFFSACKKMYANGKELKQYKFQLREIINEFGHMPALLPEGAWRADDFDWLSTIANIQHRYGFDIILQIGIRPDFENKTLNKVFVGEPSLSLGTKSMYTGEATKWHRDQYKLQIQQHLQEHLSLTEARASATAAEILDFEVQLAHGLLNHRTTKTLKSLAKLRTADELAAAYAPAIDLQKFVSIALGQNFSDTSYEYMLEYQENLARIMKRPSKVQIANYIFFQLVQHFFYYSTDTSTSSSHEKFCLEKAKSFFAKFLDHLVYQKFIYSATNEAEVKLLWQTLKDTFKAELESDKVSWMSFMTRKLSIEKLEAMRLEINSYADANFTAEYESLDINVDNYIENLKHLFAERTKSMLAALQEPPKPAEEPVKFSFTPAYISTENLIKIPVAMMQPNFLWSTHYPKAIKFGTLGYLMAHELLHGFDDLGCNFDSTGQELNWWDVNTTRAFNERKHCFKRQYSHFLYGGKYLPESDLQAENIADNGGIQVAYTAYASWLGNLTKTESKKSQKNERLPHLNYTSKQLFFISFAQFWCNDVNERLKDKVSLLDIHAPAMYRVIGSLANFNEFATAFSCARGTRMNPEHKCQLY